MCSRTSIDCQRYLGLIGPGIGEGEQLSAGYLMSLASDVHRGPRMANVGVTMQPILNACFYRVQAVSAQVGSLGSLGRWAGRQGRQGGPPCQWTEQGGHKDRGPK